jgi:hypothetical protein
MNLVLSRPLVGRMTAERAGLLSGIGFAVLQLGAMLLFGLLILPRLGPMDATIAQRAAAYAEQGDLLRLGNYLLTLPTPLFLFFLGALFTGVRRAEGDGGPLAMAAVAAGAAMAMIWPLAAILSDIGIDIALAGGDAATVASLDAIAPYSLALSALPRMVLLLTVSAALLYHELAPRWIGWLGVAAGLLSLVGTATLVVHALFPLLALSTLFFELWIIVLSLALLSKTQA